MNLFKITVVVILLINALAIPIEKRSPNSFLSDHRTFQEPRTKASFLETRKGQQSAMSIETIVIDNGCGLMKAGFAGDDTPRVVFPSVIGMPQRYPIARDGEVSSWEDLKSIWNDIFDNELRAYADGSLVMMTGRIVERRANRETMAKILFDNFNVPALKFISPAVTALYATGKTTGVVVNVGDGDFSAVPIVEGRPLTYAVMTGQISGLDLTDYLMKLLNDRGYSFTTPAEREVVRDMKEKLCYVAQDFDLEMRMAAMSSANEKNYELPDGQVITLGNERFKCPEALFKPSLLGVHISGIHSTIYDSIMRADVDVRKALFGNIVLAGGSTMFEGLADRLTKELVALVPAAMIVKVVAPPERKYLAWIGGSLTAMNSFDSFDSLEAFEEYWITKTEYEEKGLSVLDRNDYYQTSD